MTRSLAFALALFLATLGCAGGSAGTTTLADLQDAGVDDGSLVSDGGLKDGTSSIQTLPGALTPPTTTCPKALPAPATGTCDITKGSGGTVLRGTVIAPDQVFVGGEVVLDGQGVIACVGCDCSGTAGYATATTLNCGDAVISPALINTHDHITFAQNAPKPHTQKYDHRHEWRKGLNGKAVISVPGAPSGTTDAVTSWGELRFLLGGATATIGSGGVNGMLRNLDKADPMQGGLGKTPVDFETFPLGDSSPTSLPTTCTYKLTSTDAKVNADKSFLPHMSEGVNDSAHNEFECTDGINAEANYEHPQTALIHAVGLQAVDAQLAANNSVSIIWSPRSNISLYGFTATVTMYANMGLNIALGTDWSASGSMNMLRELACADAYNQGNLGGFFSDYQIWRMATENAAAAAKLADVLGQIAVGRPGDIAVFAAHGKGAYASVIRAGVADVALVLRSGLVLHGDAALVDALSPDGGAGCEVLADCLAGKKVCAMREFGKSISDLKTAIGAPYDLYFCGIPANEPSCVPSRDGLFTGVPSATDSDGDGIPNATDLCPTIFSAIRPMDGGIQQDIDGDGIGDACDPCPVAADNKAGCADTSVPIGVASDAGSTDAVTSDAGSTDASTVDAGPPQLVGIPAAQTMADGAPVEIHNVCVTAIRVATTGTAVWIQDPNLKDHAGLVVYSKTALAVGVGDQIGVTGALTTFKGLREIATPTVTPAGTCPAVILPVDVTPDAIATGGPLMAAYMSMLVQVSNVAVATAAVKATDDFVVTGQLHIAPYIFVFDATQYKAGATFKSIRGVLDYFTDHSKIDPLSAADLVPQ